MCILTLGLLAQALVACAPPDASPREAVNVVWVVWDTARADRLSAFGYELPTTPFLERWSAEARLFENCVSPASTTVPSHAAMFTGLLPTQHGAENGRSLLSDDFVTLAEIFAANGHATYAYVENPYVSTEMNLLQGFQVVQHPAQPELAEEASLATRRRALPGVDLEGIESAAFFEQGDSVGAWVTKAPELAVREACEWLDRLPRGQPFFLFLNFMEAHYPLFPDRPYREAFLSEDELKRSYAFPQSWDSYWRYTFGDETLTEADLRLINGLYDAAIAELDAHFEELIERLDAGGHLENTVVVLCGDHGEQLGEHHMLDHRYSVYEEVMRVPLAVWYPDRVPAGREKSPVMTHDLFPTLLELAGLEGQPAMGSGAVSLLDPARERRRLGEALSPLRFPFRRLQGFDRERLESLDLARYRRALRAYYDGDEKLVWGNDGVYALFDLRSDPSEAVDLSGSRPVLMDRLTRELETLVESMAAAPPGTAPTWSEDQRRALEALGYGE